MAGRRCAPSRSAWRSRSPARCSSAIRRCGSRATISRWPRSRSGSSSTRSRSQWQSVTGGYMGISGIPPIGIGALRDRLRSRAARLLVADGRACRCWSAMRLRVVALRPRLGGDRRQRGRGARARHRRRALQARGVPALGGLRGAGGLAVRARGRLRQPRGLRPAHGHARLHHALCRRHRHRRRPADRRA